ncbi:MAG: putative Ig domain-containing protein [Candidatus Thiodiazotropha sp.]|nr:putative Ig domain-containing protein [Candidatus Thiodiazotropha sp.]MCM8884906.1 putative Ig domain-containing protein [Candidatus Thiodiazotropha sp.]
MRSTQAILTAIVLSFILSACGGGSATPDSNQVANNPNQDTAVSNGGAESTPAPQEETVNDGQEVSVVVPPPPPPVKPVTQTTPTVNPVAPTTPPEDTSKDGGVQTPTDPAENEVPQPVNQVPVIGGTPASAVDAGDAYRFSPTATDGDTDTLSFSVANLPNWADFNTQNGTVSGSPTDQDVGNYNNIQITVSDGTDSATLTAFTISVNPVVVAQTTGSMSLRWTAPTTRTDGSSLSLADIKGYCIYVGTTRDNLQMQVELAEGDLTSYILDNLELGEYYVAVSVFDQQDIMSSYSNIVLKSVID